MAAGRLQTLWIALAAAGVVLICAGVTLRRAGALHLTLWLLLGAYAARLIVDSAPLDDAAPVYGAGVLLCSELAAWSLQLETRARTDAALTADRLLRTLAVALAGVAAGAVALAAATLNLPRSVPLTAAGAGAAAAAIWLIALLHHAARREPVNPAA